MPIIPTPPKDVTFTADEPPDVIRNYAGKPTPIVVMPVVATPPKDAIHSIGEPRHASEQDDGKPTASVATPHKTPCLAQMNLGMPSDTTLEN
jgi:hypothetical protein